MKNLVETIAEAEEFFKGILRYAGDNSQGESLDEVEKVLWGKLLELGSKLLSVRVSSMGNGYVGPAIEVLEEGDLEYIRERKKSYVSVFGEIEIPRAYYHKKGHNGLCPLDEELNLPERCYSYYLQELMSYFSVKGSYDEGLEDLEKILKIRLPRRSMESVVGEVGSVAEEFSEEDRQEEEYQPKGEILVVAVDGKGIPIKREGEKKERVRLKKGEKEGKKKISTVGVVYEVDRRVRSAEEIIKEVADKQESPDSPKLESKKYIGSLEKRKKEVIEEMKEEADWRDREGKREKVCLLDGERGLWTLVLSIFMGMIYILDIFHVMEYLWKASYVFFREGSQEAMLWVKEQLVRLLKGEVEGVIEFLKEALSKNRLTKSRRNTLKKVIGYFERNKKHMRYDEYLKLGYPIGSGVVEGACRHLVKDRFERTGMRWTVKGAEAVLQLRIIHGNNTWERFWKSHINKEKMRRFGSRCWKPKTPFIEIEKKVVNL